MARGLNRETFAPLGDWAYTVQSLNTIAQTVIGERVLREYVGSLSPTLLVRENLTATTVNRFVYALLLQWELWVPMFDVLKWEYISQGDERQGGFGIAFTGDHKPNAHLGDYATESARIIRAEIASGAISIR